MQNLPVSFFPQGHFQNQLPVRRKNLPKPTDAESCSKLKWANKKRPFLEENGRSNNQLIPLFWTRSREAVLFTQ